MISGIVRGIVDRPGEADIRSGKTCGIPSIADIPRGRWRPMGRSGLRILIGADEPPDSFRGSDAAIRRFDDVEEKWASRRRKALPRRMSSAGKLRFPNSTSAPGSGNDLPSKETSAGCIPAEVFPRKVNYTIKCNSRGK